MTSPLKQTQSEGAVQEHVIRGESIQRVVICNAGGEPVGCVFVPEAGALVVETSL